MLGFYEERADFAAMSEDAGYLGQCEAEIVELFRDDEPTVSAPYVIKDESRRP